MAALNETDNMKKKLAVSKSTLHFLRAIASKVMEVTMKPQGIYANFLRTIKSKAATMP
jgi:hypothetical protein